MSTWRPKPFGAELRFGQIGDVVPFLYRLVPGGHSGLGRLGDLSARITCVAGSLWIEHSQADGSTTLRPSESVDLQRGEFFRLWAPSEEVLVLALYSREPEIDYALAPGIEAPPKRKAAPKPRPKRKRVKKKVKRD